MERALPRVDAPRVREWYIPASYQENLMLNVLISDSAETEEWRSLSQNLFQELTLCFMSSTGQTT